MLRRMLYLGFAIGAMGIGIQAARGLISESQPLWDSQLVVVMVLVGFLGGYLDHQREARRAGETNAKEAPHS